MVKPQFEVGRDNVGAGGVVRDPKLRVAAIVQVAQAAIGLGLSLWAITASPLPGPSGNVEYFIAMSREPRFPKLDDIEAAAIEAVQNGPQAGVADGK